MTDTPKTKTRVGPIQAALRADILSGRLKPGSRLPLAEFASQRGTTVGVIREALLRLCSEGIVQSEPQMGFRVASVSHTALRELIEARRLIEGEAFALAIREGSLEWEASVIAAYHHLMRTAPRDDDGNVSESWVLSHRAFHESLLSGCPNERLVLVAMALRDEAELYRAAAAGSMSAEQVHAREVEHTLLRDAAIERDVERGRHILASHIELTARYVPIPD